MKDKLPQIVAILILIIIAIIAIKISKAMFDAIYYSDLSPWVKWILLTRMKGR